MWYQELGATVGSDAQVTEPRYYVMQPSEGRSGLTFATDDVFQSPGIYRRGSLFGGRGVPELRSKVKLEYRREIGPPPLDVERLGPWWIVSAEFVEFSKQIDPLAFEFLECETFEFEDSTRIDMKPRWLCATRRIGSFINAEKSTGLVVDMGAGVDGVDVYVALSTLKVAVHEGLLPADAHVFSTPQTSKTFCDAEFYRAFRSHGLRLNSFKPV